MNCCRVEVSPVGIGAQRKRSQSAAVASAVRKAKGGILSLYPYRRFYNLRPVAEWPLGSFRLKQPKRLRNARNKQMVVFIGESSPKWLPTCRDQTPGNGGKICDRLWLLSVCARANITAGCVCLEFSVCPPSHSKRRSRTAALVESFGKVAPATIAHRRPSVHTITSASDLLRRR